MKDTYLGSVYVCSCCETRMSECRCPCESWGCDNRVAWAMERVFYDLGPIVMPSPFVKMELD